MILKWNVYAGGTAAAAGKYAYDVHFTKGQYSIQPVSNQWGKHLGYRTHFINTKGALPGGLWQELGLFRSPNTAKGAVKKHYLKHFGRR